MGFQERFNLLRKRLNRWMNDDQPPEEPPTIPVYQVLARRREGLGLTQKQIGEALGCAASTVRGWDRGRMPTLRAEQYAAQLGMRVVVMEAGSHVPPAGHNSSSAA